MPRLSSLGNFNGGRMTERIRNVIKEHGRLPGDVETLADDADLYQAGMTSHASVNVMLGARGRVRRRVPGRMLKRSVFESIAGDPRGARASSTSSRGMSVAVDRDQAFSPAIRRIADEVAGAERRRRRPRTRASRARRSTRCAPSGRSRRSCPSELGGGGVSLRGRRRGLLRAGPPLRRERDGLRDAPDPGRLHRPPPGRRALVRGLPARASRPSSG